MAKQNRRQRRQNKNSVAAQAATPINMSKVMKIAIPIMAIILVLIIVALLLSTVLKKENPTVGNASAYAVKYDKNEISNGDLYYALKQNYGIDVLQDIIDAELFSSYADQLTNAEVQNKINQQIIDDIFNTSIPKDLDDLENLDLGGANILDYIQENVVLSSQQEKTFENYLDSKSNEGFHTNVDVIGQYELDEMRYLAAKDRFIDHRINGATVDTYPSINELTDDEKEEDLLGDKQKNIKPDACVIILEYKTPKDAQSAQDYLNEQLGAKSALEIYLELAAKRATIGEEGELPNNIYELGEIPTEDEEVVDERPELLQTDCASAEGLDSEFVYTVKYGDAEGSGITTELENYIYRTLKVADEVEEYWNDAYTTIYTSFDSYYFVYRANDINYAPYFAIEKDATTGKYIENEMYNYVLDIVVEELVTDTYVENFIKAKHLDEKIKFFDTVLEERYSNSAYDKKEEKGKNGKILTIGEKTYTADQLYEEMLKRKGIEMSMNMLDKYILKDISNDDSYSSIRLTKEEEKEVKETLEQQKAAYAASGYASVISWNDYLLSQYNVTTEKEALQQIRFEKQMAKYLDNYIEVTTEEIQKKYDEWFDISAKHILFETNNAHNETNSLAEKTTDEIKAMLEENVAIQYMLAQRLLEQIVEENENGFDETKEIYWGLKTLDVVELENFGVKEFEYEDFITEINDLNNMLQASDGTELTDDTYSPEKYDFETTAQLVAFTERFAAEYGITVEFDETVDTTFKDAVVAYEFEISDVVEDNAMFKNETEYAYTKSVMSIYEFNVRIELEDVRTQELFDLLMEETGGRGEDLSYFGPGKMVPEFEREAKLLANACTPDLVSGEFANEQCSEGWNNDYLRTLTYSEAPVLTDFGYHFIFITGNREKEMPITDENDENYDSVYEGNSRAYEEFWKGLEAEVENESKVQSEVLVTIREKVTIEFGNDILKNDFARFQDQNRKEIE